MKKTILFMTLVLLSVTVNGQTFQEVINEFKNKPNVELIHISKFMMNVLKASSVVMSDVSIPKGVNIKSMNVLVLDECTDATRREFFDKVSAIDFSGQGYELLVKTRDDGENVMIYGKPDGKVFSEAVIVAGDNKDATLVQMFGKLDPKKLMK
ncbi:MAG: DUF4252 domain-containing protein [Prevotella sp.]|nr:DUF4252 domain-containing protein [Prevotella sp.]